ncbi:uncharacterized protein CIMG_08230 [Coccidioides immitis RS]|uniref:Chromo domain-containing protein n=1 Tax=Coccidioides immitis (strain RS) TaxID=246410 RepID=J3K526_COCIM|nr:uncharacterized protein CIMG_08230 [Coccidioides immitis RS]EAS29484.3 hypothetical protein CIMG_08230 [Coccidioides immitis RS]
MDPFRFYNPAAVDKKKQWCKHTNCGKTLVEPLPASPLFPPPPLQVLTGVPFLTCVATTVGDCSEYTLSREPHDHHSQGQVDLMRNSSEAETSLLIKAELGVETETSAITQDLSYFGSGRSHGTFTSVFMFMDATSPQEDNLMEVLTNNDLMLCPLSPPPPILIKHDRRMEREWLVDVILDLRIQRNFNTRRFYLEYKIDWCGYAASWEPLHNVLPGCEQLVEEFHAKLLKRPNLAKLIRFETRMRWKDMTRQLTE